MLFVSGPLGQVNAKPWPTNRLSSPHTFGVLRQWCEGFVAPPPSGPEKGPGENQKIAKAGSPRKTRKLGARGDLRGTQRGLRRKSRRWGRAGGGQDRRGKGACYSLVSGVLRNSLPSQFLWVVWMGRRVCRGAIVGHRRGPKSPTTTTSRLLVSLDLSKQSLRHSSYSGYLPRRVTDNS